MTSRIQHEGTIPTTYGRDRLDQAAALMFPQYSRSRLAQWIKSGELTVDGESSQPKSRVAGGERLVIDAMPDVLEDEPEAIELNIVFADEQVVVLNKPANFVVHPGAGNRHGTLLNALLHHFPELEQVPRAGIVHRLDKDTTGLMVVARTLVAQTNLVQQMQARTVKRIYEGVVRGYLPANGVVNAPIARHPVQRTRMAVRSAGKEAITRFTLLEQFDNCGLAQFSLETGRTHQIRVHMLHLGYPLAGDPVYGGRLTKKDSEAIRNFPRQALHARRLAFTHPTTDKSLSFEAPKPADLLALLEALAVD